MYPLRLCAVLGLWQQLTFHEAWGHEGGGAQAKRGVACAAPVAPRAASSTAAGAAACSVREEERRFVIMTLWDHPHIRSD